ncbi:MAG TPA: copper chaperone PCu(A)C [Allosphingosinicella sp.]|nr:copper chaperone PCu(A)C [Allosphingosinicella sp.]
MKKTVPILAALLALAACSNEPPAAPATVRLAAVPGRPAAGYFSLRVEGDKGALVSVRSPQAGRIEMHETMSHGNMSSMRPLARIPVRDGETLSFTPGGRHLMVFDLARTVEAGGGMTLIFTFERGPEQRLIAEIVPTGGDVGP